MQVNSWSSKGAPQTFVPHYPCRFRSRETARLLACGTCPARKSIFLCPAAAVGGTPGHTLARPTTFSTAYAPHRPHHKTPLVTLGLWDSCMRPVNTPLHGTARKVRTDAFVRADTLHFLHRHPPPGSATGSCPPSLSEATRTRGFLMRLLGRSAPRSSPIAAAKANLTIAEFARRAAAANASTRLAFACREAASFAKRSAARLPCHSFSAEGPSRAAVSRVRCAFTHWTVNNSPRLARTTSRIFRHKSASLEAVAAKCARIPS